MKPTFAGALCAVSLLAAGPAAAAPLYATTLLNGFNNIVLGDLTTNVETEGTLFVGGNVNGNVTVNSRNMPDVDLGGGVSGALVVGGALSGGVNMQNGGVHIGGAVSGNINNNGGGDIAIGGAFSGNLNLNGGHATLAGPVSGNVNLNGGTRTAGPVAPVPVAEVAATLRTLSADLALLVATGGIASNSDWNNISLSPIAGPDGIAVLNLGSDFLAPSNPWGAQTGTFTGLFADPGVTTIVNVAGLNPVIRTNANTTYSNIIWNFYEAQTLTIATTFNMSILAPNATVTLNGGGINGTLVSGQLFQNAEVRPSTFQGGLPDQRVGQVPLPAPVFLLLAGLGALGGLGFRNRKRAA